MKNPFNSKKSIESRTDYDPKNPPLSADGWDPKPMRDLVFQAIGNRVGEDLAAGLREDFDHHLESDPVNGVEAAWICLTGKMIETIDKFNEAINSLSGLGAFGGNAGGGAPPSPFTMYRKDN